MLSYSESLQSQDPHAPVVHVPVDVLHVTVLYLYPPVHVALVLGLLELEHVFVVGHEASQPLQLPFEQHVLVEVL